MTQFVVEDKFTIFRREVHRFLKDTSGRRLEDLLDRLKERFDIKEDDLPTIQQAIEIEWPRILGGAPVTQREGR